MRRICFLVILITFVAGTVKAQQLPLYSQYLMNGYLLNPAIAGHDGYTSFNLTARQQWLGFPDAPQTQSFSAQTRLLKRSFVIKGRSINNKRFKPSTNGRVGLGGFFYHDLNGAVERVGFQASYAYHIFIGENQLSFGLAAGLFQFNIREQDITYLDEGDMVIEEGIRKVLYVPDANFGVHYMSYNYFVGLSVNNLFQSYLKMGNRALDEFKQLRHYYLMGGYRFYFSRDHELETSTLIKMTERFTIQADLGAKYYYRQDYWAGLYFRTDKTLITLVGIRYNQLYIGYAFDYSFSSIRRYTWGSHELVLALKLGDSARRYRWLNRY
jgi:type IX secretion system PorP/SprF family membrane protein